MSCLDGFNGAPTVSYGNIHDDFSGTQTTVSEGHPFHSRKTRMGDIGGEFRTTKSYVLDTGVKRISLTGIQSGFCTFTHRYDGPVAAYIPTVGGKLAFPPSGASSNADLDKAGATAIAQCAPGNPPANAATFLGELMKEGLPALVGSQSWKAQTDAAKAAGGDYLNVQFGWAPIVKDIKSFASAIVHADEVLSQYERDAGRVVRRRMQLPSQRSTEESVIATGKVAVINPSQSTHYSGATGSVIRKRETTRNRWFSGAFTYYLPDDYVSRATIRGLASQAKHLLGLDLTPSTAWDLTPWSWAIDWVSNTGDVINNLQRFASGGLVMRYGYLMEHTIVKDTYTLTESGLIGNPKIAPMVLVTETKTRRRANPFGFGVTWEGLTSFQASILAALGISRGK